MDVREKLAELIFDSINLNMHTHRACNLSTAVADDLIANGVTVQGDKGINAPSKPATDNNVGSKWISIRIGCRKKMAIILPIVVSMMVFVSSITKS